MLLFFMPNATLPIPLSIPPNSGRQEGVFQIKAGFFGFSKCLKSKEFGRYTNSIVQFIREHYRP